MSDLEASVELHARLTARLELNGVGTDELLAANSFGASPPQDSCRLFDDRIEWLLDEGVIRRDQDPFGDGGGFLWTHEIVLTSKAFSLLSNKMGPDLTLRQAVQAVNEGSRSYSGLGDFFGGFLGGFTKSVGS